MSNLSQTNRSSNATRLKRFTVGALPLIHRIATKMRLREQLAAYIPGHGNDLIPPVDTLLLLIYNLAIGKSPLYELDEWCASMDLQRIGIARLKQNSIFNDDRFGKALDKLFDADRSSLLTSLVMSYVEAFQVGLEEIHNDSTTIKACGRMLGRTATGFELKKGHSKDHRPDLKQLLYTLTISADGGVPIHHHCYPGNFTDDKTHIDTWKILRKITNTQDFLYVADSKLCTDEQLSYIAGKENGGRAITIIPETWSEVRRFKEELRCSSKARSIIWRRLKPNSETETEYFSLFKGDYTTDKRGYRIHWIYSSEKRRRDRAAREEALEKAETKLTALNARLNIRKLKTSQEILIATNDILIKHGIKNLLKTQLLVKTQKLQKQQGKGRPSKKTAYKTMISTLYTIAWRRDRTELKQETRLDGIFPLLSTDTALKAVQVLKAYKYQPRLEKRFAQFKTVHNAAPLLFKKIERIEANMFAFFIALALQALLEREIRSKMNDAQIDKLYIYPEDRECKRPTTSIIFDRFSQLSRYVIRGKGIPDVHFKDQLSPAQIEIISVLGITEDEYWQAYQEN
jgi:transposase